jgi:hypothetical protein
VLLCVLRLLQANRQRWSGLVKYCRQQPGVDQQLERTGEPATWKAFLKAWQHGMQHYAVYCSV